MQQQCRQQFQSRQEAGLQPLRQHFGRDVFLTFQRSMHLGILVVAHAQAKGDDDDFCIIENKSFVEWKRLRHLSDCKLKRKREDGTFDEFDCHKLMLSRASEFFRSASQVHRRGMTHLQHPAMHLEGSSAYGMVFIATHQRLSRCAFFAALAAVVQSPGLTQNQPHSTNVWLTG